MKTIIAVHSFNISGVLTQCLVWSRFLLRRGYQVLVVGKEGAYGEALLRATGVDTFKYGKGLAERIRGFASNGDVCMLMCDSIFANNIVADIARILPRIPRVLRVHEELDDALLAQGLWQYQISRRLPEILSEFRLIIFPSEHTRRFYEPLAPQRPEPRHWAVIPPTINEEMDAPPPTTHERFTILQLGTISQRKNPILSLTSFQLFLEACGPVNADLVFVGERGATRRERDYADLLRDEIRCRKLGQHVTIKPTQTSPARELHAASIVTLHSCSECTPTVFLEANFFGKMVVAPNVGGIAEIVTESVNGHLFSYGDCAEQARLFGKLYKERHSLRGMASAVTGHYHQRFSSLSVLNRLDATIQGLLHA